MMKRLGNFVVAVVVCACAAGARAQVTIDTVTVGNPGNAGELSGAGAGGYGSDRISYVPPTIADNDVGFRVAEVSEPRPLDLPR